MRKYNSCLVKESQKVVGKSFYCNYNYYICNKNETIWK